MEPCTTRQKRMRCSYADQPNISSQEATQWVTLSHCHIATGHSIWVWWFDVPNGSIRICGLRTKAIRIDQGRWFHDHCPANKQWNYQGWVVRGIFSRMKCGQTTEQIIKDYLSLAERVTYLAQWRCIPTHCTHMVALDQFKIVRNLRVHNLKGLDWVVEAQPGVCTNINSCVKDIMPSGTRCSYAFWIKPMGISFA